MPVSIAAPVVMNPLQPAALSSLGASAPDFSAVFDSEVATASPVAVLQIEAAIAKPIMPLPMVAPPTIAAPALPLFDPAMPDEGAVAKQAVAEEDSENSASDDLPVLDLVQSTLRAMAFLTALPVPLSANVPVPVRLPDTHPKSVLLLPDAAPVSVRPSVQPSRLPMAVENASPLALPVPDMVTALAATKGHGKSHEADVPALGADPKVPHFTDLAVLPAEPRAQLAPVRPASSIPAEQLFASLSRRDPVDRQWLDTVIRDVSGVASKTGDVRFRVEPDGFGRITIERTADRLEIGVSEARSLAVVEAARPQVLAGAVALGVPVSTSSVVLDQSGARHRGDAPTRQQIELGQSEDMVEDPASDAGRYA
jgi:hypothetical protein